MPPNTNNPEQPVPDRLEKKVDILLDILGARTKEKLFGLPEEKNAKFFGLGSIGPRKGKDAT